MERWHPAPLVSSSYSRLDKAKAWLLCWREREHPEVEVADQRSPRKRGSLSVFWRALILEKAAQSVFWTLTNHIIMTLLCIYVGVHWGSGDDPVFIPFILIHPGRLTAAVEAPKKPKGTKLLMLPVFIILCFSYVCLDECPVIPHHALLYLLSQ